MLNLLSAKVPRRVLLLSILLALIIMHLPSQAEPAKAINTPWLSVSGNKIKDPSGNNVTLRGVSLVDVSLGNTRTRNVSQVIDMATDNANGWYARVVRFPVYPDPIETQAGWRANPDAYFTNHLNPAITKCVSKQIYCIIDWHYIKDYNSSEVDSATRAFWTYVAPKFASTPNVIFELYNEPINPDNWSTWKTSAQPWVNLIRSFAPNNLILISGPRWAQNLSSASSSPFTGNNLVYVAHIYPQHGGQSTWDSWFGNAANSVPFFVTEWGWQNGGATPTSGTQSAYGVPFSNYLESKGLSWTAWVFDPYWQPIMFDTSWNLLGGENFMGQFTKDLLFAKKDLGLPGGGIPTNTPPPPPTRTPTRVGTTSVPPTRTPTRVGTTAVPPTRTPTRVGTAVPTTAVPTSSGTTCSPLNATVTAPFTFDGAGNLCWRISNIPSYMNSWNVTRVTVNGVDFTMKYATPSQLPAKAADGYWYISYSSSVAWGHLEIR